MGEIRYMISDAAKTVDVEAHVLRYWEEELDLLVHRNEMGHRYYTEDNIREFVKIKELKEQGYQLKVIKMLLQNLNGEAKEEQETCQEIKQDEEEVQAMPQKKKSEVVSTPDKTAKAAAGTSDRMQQFQGMLSTLISEALRENNGAVSKEVSESVIKEMDYLMRMRDEEEEARFRRIEEFLDDYERSHGVRDAGEEKKKKKAFRLFGRGRKMNTEIV